MQLARRRSRSVGIAIITGCGVFMVVAVASMHLAMTFDPTRPDSGTGGFSVFASTTAPIKVEDGNVLGVERDAIVPLRLWDGDDAGCLNLNRALRPRLFGVEPRQFIERPAFASPEEVEALWSLLEMPLEAGVVPALVGDSDTAMWGLQAKTDPETGTEYDYQNDAGTSFKIRAVGKLPMRLSLFQGSLLISETNFTRLFPHEGGYRAFLLDADDPKETAAQLNREYGKAGMEAVSAEERLRAFYAVERSYLAMFLLLGGLGLLLGAGGASIVVLRNLSERRAEFALFLAVGYEPQQVRRMALLGKLFSRACRHPVRDYCRRYCHRPHHTAFPGYRRRANAGPVACRPDHRLPHCCPDRNLCRACQDPAGRPADGITTRPAYRQAR
jgi:putative ABC transport system permease protein